MSIDAVNPHDAIKALEQAYSRVRVGDFDFVEQRIREARALDAFGGEPRRAAWIMLVEGLLGYFRSLDGSALDRVQRALAISEAAGLQDMIPRAASWLAHLHFEAGAFAQALKMAAKVYDRGDQVPIDALMRAEMVVASLHSCAAMFSEAEPYFQRARGLATQTRDRATLSAIMFNRVVFRINDLRLAAVLDNISQVDAVRAGMELSSSVNFDLATGISPLVKVSRVLRARLFLLQGRYRTAKRLLRAQVADIDVDSRIGSRSTIYLDLVWCALEEGNVEEANAIFSKLPDGFAEGLDLDDKIVFFSLMKRTAKAAGNAVMVNSLSQRIAGLVSNYEASMSELKDSLRRFDLSRV